MTDDEIRETLAKALCVIYGDAIDEARPAASALLPVVRHIAAEKLRAAARYWDRPLLRTVAFDLEVRADALDSTAVR